MMFGMVPKTARICAGVNVLHIGLVPLCVADGDVEGADVAGADVSGAPDVASPVGVSTGLSSPPPVGTVPVGVAEPLGPLVPAIPPNDAVPPTVDAQPPRTTPASTSARVAVGIGASRDRRMAGIPIRGVASNGCGF